MTPDDKLNAVLKQSKGIEPGPGFEQRVWSRIHTAKPVPVQRWREWVAPLAVAAGIMLGIGLGLLIPANGKAASGDVILARNGSLTGAYLALSSGEGP